VPSSEDDDVDVEDDDVDMEEDDDSEDELLDDKVVEVELAVWLVWDDDDADGL
jgi:hypothetical protein